MKAIAEPHTTTRLKMTKARKMRAYERTAGYCVACGLKVEPGTAWTCEHIVPLSMQGSDTDENLGPAHNACATVKTAEEATVRAKVYRVRQRHLGITSPGRQAMPFGKGSAFKKKISGEVVRRPPKMMPWKR